jgi:hypothetical protein
MTEQSAESKPAEQSADNPIVKNLGPAITGLITFSLTWLTAGSTDIKPALVSLAAVAAGICALVTSLLYQRYFSVLALGAEPEMSPQRMAYVRLWNSLAEGGRPAVIYVRWPTKFLDWVDRFFGDAGMADRTLFPRAFGLKTPAPLWTAPAFERCLLLALIYPVAAIFLIWAISGHVGPAEVALELSSNISSWKRGLEATLVGFLAFYGAGKRHIRLNFLWIAALAAAAFCLSTLVGGGHFIVWVTILLFLVGFGDMGGAAGPALIVTIIAYLFIGGLASPILGARPDSRRLAVIIILILFLASGVFIAIRTLSDRAIKR